MPFNTSIESARRPGLSATKQLSEQVCNLFTLFFLFSLFFISIVQVSAGFTGAEPHAWEVIFVGDNGRVEGAKGKG